MCDSKARELWTSFTWAEKTLRIRQEAGVGRARQRFALGPTPDLGPDSNLIRDCKSLNPKVFNTHLKDVTATHVEYCPCVIANDCWNLLIEFMQSFMGSHTPGIPSVFGTKHDSIYSPADTMVQYMELFNKIRKQQQVPVAGIR
ncbi:mediator of RNA polymerase II transcription subunit 20 isoform X4 [Apteryx rowi]|uniref:mediator of RNA polymerase II transcription subunit 20 isoform X4 n=1 Tax=Apteryx rowi TaxID=308060 RepID=UPI000E1D4A1F|nr:mediator of RNA polymerase II transcription subunit 20 isoform X4 [Apteryx rowi]